MEDAEQELEFALTPARMVVTVNLYRMSPALFRIVLRALPWPVGIARADDGWPQTDGQESDAYSTAQTLFMLCQMGSLSDDPAVQRARDFLRGTQLADGSWLVASRVKTKAQPSFENGDPSGEDRFISTAATSWAIAHLPRAETAPKAP